MLMCTCMYTCVYRTPMFLQRCRWQARTCPPCSATRAACIRRARRAPGRLAAGSKALLGGTLTPRPLPCPPAPLGPHPTAIVIICSMLGVNSPADPMASRWAW